MKVTRAMKKMAGYRSTCISSEIYERDVLVKREQEERQRDIETGQPAFLSGFSQLK
jgi:hypothetical protein